MCPYFVKIKKGKGIGIEVVTSGLESHHPSNTSHDKTKNELPFLATRFGLGF
jgi:hypothetical protein